MKPQISLLALFTAVLHPAQAYWKGFNVQSTLSNGACKSTSDYIQDFNAMRNLPGSFTSMRLIASSDCNALSSAIPAALATGGKILAGVWTEDLNHFNSEKYALLRAVQTWGFDWLVAVSVGSEDLLRGETNSSYLAQQIYDVRGMLTTVQGYTTAIQVGHVDSWNMWVNPSNADVIRASDFVGTDGYPYWQNQAGNNWIDDGYPLFWDGVTQVRNQVNVVKPGVWVWITATGWPVDGPVDGLAVPSVQNAQFYWKGVACRAFGEANTFWYVFQDIGAIPGFGVVDGNFNPIYDLSC